MPYLSPEDREALLVPLAGLECNKCKEVKIRNYCRQCDEFFHSCGCGPDKKHKKHRVYLWTLRGILSVPPSITETRRVRILRDPPGKKYPGEP